MTRLVEVALKFPRLTLVVWLLALVVVGAGIPQTTAEVGYRILLGEDHPAIKKIDGFIERYGGGLPVIVAWECGPGFACDSALDPVSLMMAHGVETALQSEPSIRDMASPASMPLMIASEDGISLRRMVIDGRVVDDHLFLAERALGDAAWTGNLIDSTGTVGAIIMQTASAESASMQSLVEALFSALEPYEELGFVFHPVGDPIDFVVAGGEMKAETPRIIPVLVTLLAVIAYLLLRSAVAVGLSLMVSGGALVIAMGTMGWLGWPEVEWTQALPPFILVSGFCNSVHLLVQVSARADERSDPRIGAAEILEAASSVGLGCFLASLTTALAVLSFISSGFASFAQFGVIAAVGVSASLAITFSAIPVLLTRFPRETMLSRIRGRQWRAFLDELVAITCRRSRMILIGAVVLCGFSAVGLMNLTIDIDEQALLGRGSKVVRWANWVEERLRKADGLEIEFILPQPNVLGAPENLHAVDDLVSIVGSHPRLGAGWSIVDLVKGANQAMNDDEASYYAIADTHAENATLLMLLGMGNIRAIDSWLTIDQQRVRASFTADPMSMKERTEVLADVRDRIGGHLPTGWTFELTGPLQVYAVFVQEIQRTQLASFGTAAVAIGVVLALFFWLTGSRLTWSLRWALAALGVSAFPVLLTLGTMGLLGIPLDAGTAMVGAIVLGVAVDDSVHLIVLYRRHRNVGSGAQASIEAAIGGAGRALVTTSAALSVGFFALLMSSWSSIASFGLLSGVAVLGALIADLVILPALVVAASGGEQRPASPSDDPAPRTSARFTMLGVIVATALVGVAGPQVLGTGWQRSGSVICDVIPGDGLFDFSGFADRCGGSLPSLNRGHAGVADEGSASVGRSAILRIVREGGEEPSSTPVHAATSWRPRGWGHLVQPEEELWAATAIASLALILGAAVVRFSVSAAAIPFGMLAAISAICGFFRVVGANADLHPAPEFVAYALLWAPLVHLALAYPLQHSILRRAPILPSVIYWSALIVVAPTIIGYWRLPELFLASRALATGLICSGVVLLSVSMLRPSLVAGKQGEVITARWPFVVSALIVAGCLVSAMNGGGAGAMGMVFIAAPVPIGVDLLGRTATDSRSALVYGFLKGLASLAVALFGVVAALSMFGEPAGSRSLLAVGAIVALALLLQDAIRQIALRWLAAMTTSADRKLQSVSSEFVTIARNAGSGEEVCFELVDRIHRHLKPRGVLLTGQGGAVLATVGEGVPGAESDRAGKDGRTELTRRYRLRNARVGLVLTEAREPSVEIRHAATMRHNGKLCLVVTIREDNSSYSRGEVDFAASLVDVAAVALDRASLADEMLREERYETIGRVGAGLMHDIGRRATSITRRARDLTSSDLVAEHTRTEAVRIESMASEISGCIRRLTEFSDGDHQKSVGAMPLLELVDSAVCSTRHMHPKARINVSCDVGSTRITCANDLGLALINVLDNSVRASDWPAEVEVSVRQIGDRVCIEIRDHGCGMTPEQQARAFDAFWTTRADGSGLGLASVKNTVARLGGSVSLESEAGRGSVVCLTLPANGALPEAASC